jgi:hypothetical protein
MIHLLLWYVDRIVRLLPEIKLARISHYSNDLNIKDVNRKQEL